MGIHSKFSPSSSSRWLECTASIERYKHIDDVPSDYAKEGTDAHTIAEYCIKNSLNPYELRGNLINKRLDAVFKGVHVTREMCGFLETYIDYVADYSFSQIWIEKKLDFSDYAPHGFGTADFMSYDKQTKTVHIIDLKYGQYVKVLANNNTQLKLYALGAYSELNYLGVEQFELHIVQPRMGYIDSETVTVKELLGFGDFVKERSKEALQNPQFRPGGETCKWCALKGDCKALSNYSKDVLKTQDFKEFIDTDTLNDEDIANIILNANLIKKFVESVEIEAYKKLVNNQKISGIKLVKGITRRAWKDEAKVFSVLSAELEEDEIYEKKLIGITKAEKLIGKKSFNSKYSDLYEKSKTKLKIVSENDKRQNAMLDDVENDFNNLEVE
jgi:hypothetical protein